MENTQQRPKQVTNNNNLVTFRAPVPIKDVLDSLTDSGVISNRTLYLNKLVKKDLERRGFVFDGLELEKNQIS